MDSKFEGHETRSPALDVGFIPVVPPHPKRVVPWRFKKALNRRGNEIERPFRRLKGVRRAFSRFHKLGLVFIAFIYFALIVEALREQQ
jgi:transposase